MKAFILYSDEEFKLRQLLRQLQSQGKVNCDFETFSKLYKGWHAKTFPGCPINVETTISKDEWLKDFVIFLANKDI